MNKNRITSSSIAQHGSNGGSKPKVSELDILKAQLAQAQADLAKARFVADPIGVTLAQAQARADAPKAAIRITLKAGETVIVDSTAAHRAPEGKSRGYGVWGNRVQLAPDAKLTLYVDDQFVGTGTLRQSRNTSNWIFNIGGKQTIGHLNYQVGANASLLHGKGTNMPTSVEVYSISINVTEIGSKPK